MDQHPYFRVQWGINQMLLWKCVSTPLSRQFNYMQSSRGSPSPDLAADAVQTCWRHKALLSEWLIGTWRTQKRDESVVQHTLSAMTRADFTFARENIATLRELVNKELTKANISPVQLCREKTEQSNTVGDPFFHSYIMRPNLALNGNTDAALFKIPSAVNWDPISQQLGAVSFFFPCTVFMWKVFKVWIVQKVDTNKRIHSSIAPDMQW